MKSLKKFFGVVVFMFLLQYASGQGTVTITSGAYIVSAGTVVIVLNDMDLTNNGFFQSAGTATSTFTGTTLVTIGGTGSTTFGNLDIVKGTGTVSLTTNVDVNTRLNFQSGLLNLNNSIVHLGTTGTLSNETETSRATTSQKGYIEAIATLNAPSSANPGNLGAVITSSANMGSTTIRRGHYTFPNVYAYGGKPSIQRFFDIIPTNNSGLNATLRFKYFDAELNGLNESLLAQWKTRDSINWFLVSCDNTRDPANNFVETVGSGSFSLTTLSELQPVNSLLGTINATCNASTGSINVYSVTGGTGSYTYSLDGVSYVPAPPSGPTFPSVPAGVYNVYVKDGSACVKIVGTSTVTQPTPITFSVTQGSPITCSNSTTTLTVAASGGTGTYTYRLDGGAPQNNNVLTTGMGTHNITVTDAAGCSGTSTVTVNGTSTVSFNSVTVTNNTCYNGIAGRIAVQATGAGTITYTLTAPGGSQTTLSGPSGTTLTFSALSAGNYTITAVDNTNCPVVTTTSVSQPAPVMAPDNSNGSPDLLLTSVINPPTATFTAGSVVTITYTISVKNNSNISAQGVIIRITKPFSGYVINASGNAWNKITDNSTFAEFQLKAGFEIPCSGSMTAGISITRAGLDSQSPGLPITATVRMPGANQDNHDQDNARASQFRVQ